MKFVALSFALAFAASSYASFEMMLIADNTNGVIHRYDPVNRVYLGSFGQGSLLTVTSMTLDQTRGRVYVSQGGLLTAFNYSSGDAIFTTGSGGGVSAFRADSGDIITVSGSTLLRRSVFDTGIGTANTYVSGLGAGSQITTKGSDVFVANPVTGVISRYSGFSSGTLSLTSNVAGGMVGDTLAGMITGQSGDFVNVLSATDKRYFSLGTAGQIGIVSGATSSLNTTTAIASGHGNFFYFLGTTPTGFGIQKYYEDGNTFTSFSQVALPSQIGAVNAAVTVVAPEPGSMIALGVGIAALLRKRRSKKA